LTCDTVISAAVGGSANDIQTSDPEYSLPNQVVTQVAGLEGL